jgi:uncharacterized protein
MAEGAQQPAAAPVVLVTGATGTVGRTLVPFLRARGFNVRTLGRGGLPGPDAFRWDPARGEVDPAALGGLSAVVHLAGENVAGGRWTPARRRAILGSRVTGTRALLNALSSRTDRPPVIVSASAVGYYGNRGDELLTEESPAGSGFLAGVCEAWEKEAAAAEAIGMRSVRLRIGVVLDRDGGALRRMLPAFRLGLGGRLGPGSQWMSWISGGDLAGMIETAIRRGDWRGAFNAVAPEPVTNARFTALLAAALHRPAFLPVPTAALRLLFGEMARETLLSSARAIPARATSHGFVWRHPDLEGALRSILG